MPDSTVELPPSAAMCVVCGHWADWHHRQEDGTFPCIGGCGCLDYRDAHIDGLDDAGTLDS